MSHQPVTYLLFGVGGVIAIILGSVAMNGMKRTGNMQGRGMALAGLILGIIDIVSGAAIAMVWIHNMHHAVRPHGF